MERDKLIRGAYEGKKWAIGLSNGSVIVFKWSDPDDTVDNGVVLHEATFWMDRYADVMDYIVLDAFYAAWIGRYNPGAA